MAKRTVSCRVCGKLFVPCNKSSASLGAFNYHSIACSPECGEKYLIRVQEARKQHEQNETAELVVQIRIDETVDLNIAGETSENEVNEIAEPAAKTTRSRNNKQETNEEE